MQELHGHEGGRGPVVSGWGAWEGSYGGLRGGVSGLAWFEAEVHGKVTTSAWSRPVPAEVYEVVSGLAGEIYHRLGVSTPELKRNIMDMMFRRPILIGRLADAKATSEHYEALAAAEGVLSRITNVEQTVDSVLDGIDAELRRRNGIPA